MPQNRQLNLGFGGGQTEKSQVSVSETITMLPIIFEILQ